MGEIPSRAVPQLEDGRRALEDRECAGQKHLPCEAALDLAAGRLGQAAGTDQDDLTSGNFVFPGDRFADRGDYLFFGDLPSDRTLDLLDQDQLLLAVVVGHTEGGATMAAQRRMAILHRLLDVLRVMVDAADDDQVLGPASDVKFAILVEKAEIAGPQPVLGGVA